jgi:ABC-2 type transport system ATP-binding protein
MAQVEEFCQDICLIKHGEVKLTGNLREIKNSYPKDKILVITDAGEQKTVAAPADGDLTKIIKDFNGGIESISVLKPSLLEIFLEKVGDDDEGA